MNRFLTPVLPLALGATVASAADAPPAMIAFAQEQVAQWINVPEVVSAITAQNAKNANLTEADILVLDGTWRDEVGSGGAFVSEVIGNALSKYLKEKTDATGGLITEVFVMDQYGLNVGQSALTSDYWQGDEAKFQETYPKGADAMHVSEIELDESTQTYQGQVSMPVVDADGTVVGAVTFGLNAESFF